MERKEQANRPELLAPAGSFEALKTAVACGADAVYFGCSAFSARAYAKNFAGDELRQAIDYCHLRGVKAHAAVNTLILDREMKEALATVAELYELGVDALIVQDVGLIAALRANFPDLPLHASTQMAVHTPAGVRAVANLGVERAVLAREVSLKDIQAIRQEVPTVELEAFVGGAMCTSVSGLCLFSSLVGGRSGNRGECAQPCRMKFAFEGEQGYLLSMKDLCALDLVGELCELGVASLKIEGRMKRPEYVGASVLAYRAAIDGRGDLNEARKMLLRAFHRGGFSDGYFLERDGKVAPERPGNWGVPVGKLTHNGIDLTLPVVTGDELCVRRPGADEDETVIAKHDLPQGFSRFSGLKGEGLTVYRTVDKAQNDNVLRTARESPRTALAAVALTARCGEPLSFTMRALGQEAAAAGNEVQPAQNAPATPEKLRALAGKLGGTPFSLGTFDCDTDGAAFVPASAVNELRRKAVEELSAKIVAQGRRAHRAPALPPLPTNAEKPERPVLVAQVAALEQAKAAVEGGAQELYVQPRLFTAGNLQRLAAPALEKGLPVFAVLPPVLLGEEEKLAYDAVFSAGPGTFSGAVASNIGNISVLKQEFADVRGDFTLNIANSQSAAAYRALGLGRAALSAELTAAQIRDIINHLPAEVVVYGRLPLMHLLHCPERARRGKCAKDCFVGCSAKPRALTDRRSVEFALLPLTVAPGRCNVQVLNSLPLDGLRVFGPLAACGASAWRLNFTTESGAEVKARLAAYRQALAAGEVRPLERSTAGRFARGFLTAQARLQERRPTT